VPHLAAAKSIIAPLRRLDSVIVATASPMHDSERNSEVCSL